MLDYGIFYEFVPVEDLGSETPRRHTVADLELGRPYAVVMSTPGGLWSYTLGDTVRFTARDPLRLVITGRTRHYVNAFGENVLERWPRAGVPATRRKPGGGFTVPRGGGAAEAAGGTGGLVEFGVAPTAPRLAADLDEGDRHPHNDYSTKRAARSHVRPP